jgi:16S rRNA (guanine966-N2)-methyltransferase
VRVVAGALKSRALKAPKGDATRPTSDRVRESLFAVLGDVSGVAVLDLYAGSGALAIEALSRGAARAVCVEVARPALMAIRDNVTTLGLDQRLTVLARRVEECAPLLAAHGPFDLVLIDPPYADVPSGDLARDLAPLLARREALFSVDALVVLEHAARDPAPVLTGLVHEDDRRWGDTAAAFYRATGEERA